MSNMTLDADPADIAKSFTTPLMENALFNSRTVLVVGEINDRIARATTERLLAMSAESDDPITMIVSSPGGHVESGDMIHDMVKFIKPEVRMVGSGWCASAGALIYVAAKKENRVCLPNTRFLLHEPRGGVGGSASVPVIQACAPRRSSSLNKAVRRRASRWAATSSSSSKGGAPKLAQ